MNPAVTAAVQQASGAIVQLEQDEFRKILSKSESPLVVTALGGVFSKNYQYLTSYKGLYFYCKSDTPIRLPSGAEGVQSKKIWIPE